MALCLEEGRLTTCLSCRRIDGCGMACHGRQTERKQSHAPQTLEACLERLAHMEYPYLVTQRGYYWTVAELLAALRQWSPHLLAQPVAVCLPMPNLPGAIAHLDEHGGVVVRYHLEERGLAASPP